METSLCNVPERTRVGRRWWWNAQSWTGEGEPPFENEKQVPKQKLKWDTWRIRVVNMSNQEWRHRHRFPNNHSWWLCTYRLCRSMMFVHRTALKGTNQSERQFLPPWQIDLRRHKSSSSLVDYRYRPHQSSAQMVWNTRLHDMAAICLQNDSR